MFRQHPLRFYIANAFLNLNTLKKNKHVEKKEPAPATPDVTPATPDVLPPEVMLGGSDPAEEQQEEQQFCLTVSRKGTQATFNVEKTSECFISDCSTTDQSHGDPYHLIDYDRRSFALKCFIGVVARSLHTVDTTSTDFQSIKLGNNAFVYYNKDGWFADQWTYQPTEVCFSDYPPFVLTPSISYAAVGIEPVSTTDNFIPPMAAYQDIPFYAYSTKVGGYSSFYMTVTLPSGPNPPQNVGAFSSTIVSETPILSIFHSDGTVATYKNPTENKQITFSDASNGLMIRIGKVEGSPTYTITYSFPEPGDLLCS